MAVAAVVLLGAIVGGVLWLRQSRSAEPVAAQPVAAVQSSPAPVPPAAIPQGVPILQEKQGAVVQAKQEPAATPRVDARTSARSAEPVVSSSAEEAPKIVAPTKAPSREAVARVIDKLSAPVTKKSPSTSASEPPPVLPASATAAEAGNSLLLSSDQNRGPVSPATIARNTTLVGGRVLEPKLVSSPAPPYPPQAALQRVQGDVVVDALVDVKGRVTEARAISGPPLLQQAAINAVRNWRYEPARLDGEPVAAHLQVRISFHLP